MSRTMGWCGRWTGTLGFLLGTPTCFYLGGSLSLGPISFLGEESSVYSCLENFNLVPAFGEQEGKGQEVLSIQLAVSSSIFPLLDASHLALTCAYAADSHCCLGYPPRMNLVFCLAGEELLPGCMDGAGTRGMNCFLHRLPISHPLLCNLALYLCLQGYIILPTPESSWGPGVQ